MVYPQHLFRNY